MYTYIKIIEYLNYLIEKNKDNDEFLLPSESQLCTKFNTSRISVRRAFNELKKSGAIYSEKGKGYYVNNGRANPSETNYHRKISVTFICTNLNTHHRLNILNGINQFCNQNDICCNTMLSYNDPLLEQNKLSDATYLQCNGIILFPADSNNYSIELFKLLKHNIPVVLLDRNLPGLNLPYVSSNHFEMGYNAIEWFYKKNIKDIVFISHTEHLSSAAIDRQNGIQKGLLDFMGRINAYNLIYNVVPENELYNFYYNYFFEHSEIKGIIYTSSDKYHYLIKALNDLNKKINEDFFIIFIDNEHLNIFNHSAISCPTIIQDGVSIGYTAAKLLLEIIHSPNSSHDTIYVPTKFINWE